VRPKWSKAVGKRPAMLVLHGSGGLLKDPKSKADQPCSPQMEAQFVDWSDRLARLGYTVLLPSSYSARGFCDKHTDAARMPETFDDKPEQILSRLYDVDAASRYLCDRAEVDCDRMGLLGFSQGATMVMVAPCLALPFASATRRPRRRPSSHVGGHGSEQLATRSR